MSKIGVNRPLSSQAPIALGLVLVAALVIFGSMRLLSPHRAVLIATEAGSQARSCPTGYPGKPTPPCSFRPAAPPPSAHVVCTVGGLRLSAMWPGAYHGFTGESLELVNTTDAPCYLGGAPPMKVSTTSGGMEPVSQGDFVSTRVDVQPGEDLFIELGSPGACANAGTPDSASGITLSWPGGTMTVSGLRFGVECGVPLLQIFEIAPVPMQPPTTPSLPPSGSGAKSG